MITKSSFVISAATHYGLEEFLNALTSTLQKTNAQEVYHLENIPVQTIKEVKNRITNISDTEKKLLQDEGYMTEFELKYISVWLLYHPEIAKLVWMLPR